MTSPFYLRFANETEALAKLQEAKLRTLGQLDIAGVKIPHWFDDPNLVVVGESYRPDVVPTIRKDFFLVHGGGRLLGCFENDQAAAEKCKADFDGARQEDEHGNLPPEATITKAVRNDRDHSKPVVKGTKRDGYFAHYTGDTLPAVLEPYDAKPVSPFCVPAGFSPEEIAAREVKAELPL